MLVRRRCLLLHFFSPPLVSPFPFQENWRVLRSLGFPFGVELALVNSSFGMQRRILGCMFLCIFFPHLAVSAFLPFFSRLRFVFFLRDFSGALLS